MYKDTHTHTKSQKNWSKKWYIHLLFPWCPFSLGNLEVSLWFKKLFYFYPGCSMSCNELTLNKYHFSSCVLQSFSLLFVCCDLKLCPSLQVIICAILFQLQTLISSKCYWGIFVYSLFSSFITNYWRRQWQPTPVLLPGKSHGRRSLVGCSPWGH